MMMLMRMVIRVTISWLQVGKSPLCEPRPDSLHHVTISPEACGKEAGDGGGWWRQGKVGGGRMKEKKWGKGR